MSGPVDVLAVLDEFALYVRNVSSRHALQGDILETRAAVAELIEADNEYGEGVAAHKELIRRIAEQGWYELEADALRKAGEQVVRAQSRRQAALANAGGAK